MKREDLESKVEIAWERCPGYSEIGVDKCVASLQFRSEALLDPVVEKMFPCGPVSIRHELGKRVRDNLIHALIGDLEAENARLRAAVAKWYGRARPCCSTEAMEFREELGEDLR